MAQYEKEIKPVFKSIRILIYVVVSLVISALIGLALSLSPQVPSYAIFVVASGFFISAMLYLIILDYVYHDAKKRGMNHWLWIAIVIFIPYLLGFVFYLMLRTPIKRELCPQCRHVVSANHVFCSHCGKKIKIDCPKCKKIIEPDQKFCAFCGYKLKIE